MVRNGILAGSIGQDTIETVRYYHIRDPIPLTFHLSGYSKWILCHHIQVNNRNKKYK